MTLRYAPRPSVAGSCPRCGSTNTATSPNGAHVCIDCGRVW